MTVRFRINTITLDTTEGEVHYAFPSDLTVLAGKTGVGKTTLLELIKFGFGGNAALADIARNHVREVTLEVAIGDSRLQISRSLDTPKSKKVHVTDLSARERLPDHHIDATQPSLNTLLMTGLGLPDDLKAAVTAKGSTNAGSRITFADIFAYLYVPQAAINREIARSGENYYQPKRKAVFELLFGLTNPDIMKLQSEVNSLNGKIAEAEKEHQTVLTFLRDSNTTARRDAQNALDTAVAAQAAAEAEQTNLRNAVDPITDRETQALRDMLNDAERGLAEARALVTHLTRQIGEYTVERRRVQTDLARLQRMHDAGERLADIEFVVCPRCMQSLSNRSVPDSSCRVCLQPDPVQASASERGGHYEILQLTDQLAEMDDHLAGISAQLEGARQAEVDRAQLVEALTAKIDARLAERLTPRLQAFSDAADRLAAARTQQQHLEQILRQWDRVDDLGSVVQRFQSDKERVLRAIREAQDAIDSRKREVLDALNDEFQRAASELGIPGVQRATINRDNYLPMLNGQKYSTFSGPGGGIITATQVAYWTSLLNVALRDRQTHYPAFLLIDTPRLALQAESLAAALYRRLVGQADANPGRIQLIIADNELPADYRRHYQEIHFTYQNPTIPTILHPGPNAVRKLVDSDAEAEGEDVAT
ncbi:AAA family ATPase [Spirillospora sp. NPDC047418]